MRFFELKCKAYLKKDIEKYNLEVNSKRLLQMRISAWFFTSTSPAVLRDKIEAKDTLALIDIRSIEEFRTGHIPNSINYPINEMIRDSAEAISAMANKDLIIISSDGTTAKLMAAWLEDLHFTHVGWLQGGIENWEYARTE